MVDSWARGVVPMMEGQLLKSEEVISDAPENEEVEETLNRKSCREETAVNSPGITDEQYVLCIKVFYLLGECLTACFSVN